MATNSKAAVKLVASAAANVVVAKTGGPQDVKTWRDTYRGKYKVVHIGIGPKRLEKYGKLVELAKTLGIKDTQLFLIGMERVLENPPTKEQLLAMNVEARGTSSGFGIIITKDDNGRATGLYIQEVEKRSELPADNFQFHRYDGDDVKARGRALNAAQRSAAQMKRMMGLPDEYVIENKVLAHMKENAGAKS